MNNVVKFNHFSKAGQHVREAAQEATIGAAETLRDILEIALNAGTEGIRSDAHALAESLYVKATNGRNDYAEALSKATDAFRENPSRYRSSPASESALKNFEAITADYEPLADAGAHSITAAVATMLAYGGHWEFEGREWMSPPVMEWATTRLAEFYAKVMSEHISSGF